MKGLTISGGGALGSYAIGMAEAHNRTYDLIAGNSTGALAAPMIALKKYKKAREGYEQASNDQIYSVRPFNAKGQPRIGLLLRRFLTGKTTLGDTTPLLAFIRRFFTEEDYHQLRHGKTKVYIAVHNLNTNVHDPELNPLEVICSHDTGMSYQMFTRFMQASCSMIPFASICEIGGYQYADGGLSESMLTDYLIDLGVREIDCYILRPAPFEKVTKETRIDNMIDTFKRLWLAMRKDLEYENLNKLIRRAKMAQDLSLQLYYLPEKLTNNSMDFDPGKQALYYQQGYQYAFDALVRREYGYKRKKP